MANQSRVIAIVTDTLGNLATFGYTYDDVTLLINLISVVNGTGQGVFASAKRTDGSKTYSTTVPANTNQSIPVASNTASRLQLTTTPSGRLDGVEIEFRLV